MGGLSIPLDHVLLLAALLFICGLTGLMIRRNVIFILMSLEVMLNAAALAFVAAGAHWGERLIVERGFACMVELLLKLRYCNPVIVEVPLVLEYDRKQSPSKIRILRTIMQYLNLAIRDRVSPAPHRKL